MLSINGLNYHVNLWGDPSKPKLFLIHGFLDSGSSFQFVAEYLKNDFYCIAPDLRGFGCTDWTTNELGYFYFEYVADVHKIFEHYSPNEPVKILGHSMGGNILSIYAGTFPERVSHFINVEGFGINDMPPENGPSRLRTWIEEKMITPFSIYATHEDLAERLQKANPRLPKDRALLLAQGISREVSGGVQVRFDPKHRWVHPYLYQLKNVEEFWKKITAKCMFVIGSETDWGSRNSKGEGFQKEIDRRLTVYPKGSVRTVIPNSGHMIHHEQPEALSGTTKTFLMLP